MRPKKTILVVHADDEQRGMWRFLLDVHHYRVLSASDAPSAQALAALGVDLVLVFGQLVGMEWEQLAERMKQAHPNVPILLIGLRDVAAANVAWCPAKMENCELLERVRCLIARKRGPRKKLELVPALVAGD